MRVEELEPGADRLADAIGRKAGPRDAVDDAAVLGDVDLAVEAEPLELGQETLFDHSRAESRGLGVRYHSDPIQGAALHVVPGRVPSDVGRQRIVDQLSIDGSAGVLEICVAPDSQIRQFERGSLY